MIGMVTIVIIYAHLMKKDCISKVNWTYEVLSIKGTIWVCMGIWPIFRKLPPVTTVFVGRR